jgi:hypothetical protein
MVPTAANFFDRPYLPSDAAFQRQFERIELLAWNLIWFGLRSCVSGVEIVTQETSRPT